MHALRLALVLLVCWMPVSGVCAATRAVIAEEDISGAEQGDRLLLLSERLLQTLAPATATAELQTSHFAEVADLFGKLVARGQALKTDAAFFFALREASDKLYGYCHDFIRAAEDNLHEDEAALEQLYRSEIWYDLNYALAAFRYWRAWIELSIARLQMREEERVGWLNRAESGFQTASVRILYPGIVYGSWLGMSYVSLARDDKTQAKKRLETLRSALGDYPDDTFRETVEIELALLDPEKMQAQEITVNEPITRSSQARLAVEQAFMLLEQHRDGHDRAIQAAQLLKPVLESGWLSDALVTRLMQYKAEIVGQDIGVLELLVGAEYAYQYQQYYKSVLKYRKFIGRKGGELPLDLARYQYHFAASLQLIGLHQEAFRELSEVKRQPDLSKSLRHALVKLEFIVTQTLYQQHDSAPSRQRLLTAAKAFIATSPEDEDSAAAHLVMARLGQERQLATHLKSAAANPVYRSAAAQVRLQRALDQFGKAVLIADSQAVTQAADNTLKALELLPRKLRNQLANRCLAVQMKTVPMKRPPEKILEEIISLEREPLLTEACRHRLTWSKLRVLTRLNDYQALSTMILDASGDGMIHQQVFVFLRELKQQRKTLELETLARLFAAVLQTTPDLLRQVQLMRIENLQAAGSHDDAFKLAQALVQQFPKSGNAWFAYAKAAKLAGQLDNAARGWARITSAVPQGSPRWIEAMLERAELSLRQGDSSSRSCELLGRVTVYNHLLEKREYSQFIALQQAGRCPILPR